MIFKNPDCHIYKLYFYFLALMVSSHSRRKGEVIYLGEAKALRALADGDEQLLPEQVLSGILGQVQLVEAGVRRGQQVAAAEGLVDVELLDAVRALQSGEPVEGHLKEARKKRETEISF